MSANNIMEDLINTMEEEIEIEENMDEDKQRSKKEVLQKVLNTYGNFQFALYDILEKCYYDQALEEYDDKQWLSKEQLYEALCAISNWGEDDVYNMKNDMDGWSNYTIEMRRHPLVRGLPYHEWAVPSPNYVTMRF